MSKEIGDVGDSAPSGSYASAATNIKPKLFRLLKHINLSKYWKMPLAWLIGGLVLFVVSLFIDPSFQKYAFFGAVFCLVKSVMGWLHFRKVVDAQTGNFTRGLLTAALVEQTDPNVVLTHIAALQKTDIEPRHGVFTNVYSSFPKVELIKGQKIPCSAGFDNFTNDPYTWDSYSAMPLFFGTSDQSKIERALEVIEFEDEEISPFLVLERFLEKNPEAKEIGNMYVCDDSGTLIETRDDSGTWRDF